MPSLECVGASILPSSEVQVGTGNWPTGGDGRRSRQKEGRQRTRDHLYALSCSGIRRVLGARVVVLFTGETYSFTKSVNALLPFVPDYHE